MDLLLLDVSFGVFDILRMILGSPIAVAIYVILGVFLIGKGVKAIRRELAKKNSLPGDAAPMIESEDPVTEPLAEAAEKAAEPLAEAAAPAEAAAEAQKTE